MGITFQNGDNIGATIVKYSVSINLFIKYEVYDYLTLMRLQSEKLNDVTSYIFPLSM